MLNIFFLGLVSFFTDLSTEMVYPLIPLYLNTVLGASPALMGLIEGIAESLASLLKVYSGALSDRFKRKKPLAFLGYSAALFYKAALLVSTSWLGVLLARVIDKFGKGIRTAPRDVLVSESAPANQMGRAYGLHKALDMLGSALGILISYFLLAGARDVTAYRRVFTLSLIPMGFALLMFLLIKEPLRAKPSKSQSPLRLSLKGLDPKLRLYLFVVTLFTLGNSSNTFLLLRARGAGYGDGSVILLYFAYNLVSALLSVPLGRLSDRLGRKRLISAAYFCFSLVYGLFALGGKGPILLAFPLYGLYTGLISGAERAYIAQIAPADLKGSILGLHGSLTGLALFPASLIAGFLWTALGPQAPFALGALLSFLCALILIRRF